LKLPITNLLLLGYHSDQRLTSLIASRNANYSSLAQWCWFGLKKAFWIKLSL